MKTILMKFSGPMQAWGTSSHFETRHTDDHPSKSGVIGLVAAALGWRRDDARIATLNAMTFAVRVDQPGTLLKDYQTAHKVSKKNNQSKLISQFYHGEIHMFTYVTSRYYLEDAVFTVALGIPDSHQADTIADALQAPYFQPYMGRRALPSGGLLPRGERGRSAWRAGAGTLACIALVSACAAETRSFETAPLHLHRGRTAWRRDALQA